jgi:hypothetical protein
MEEEVSFHRLAELEAKTLCRVGRFSIDQTLMHRNRVAVTYR